MSVACPTPVRCASEAEASVGLVRTEGEKNCLLPGWGNQRDKSGGQTYSRVPSCILNLISLALLNSWQGGRHVTSSDINRPLRQIQLVITTTSNLLQSLAETRLACTEPRTQGFVIPLCSLLACSAQWLLRWDGGEAHWGVARTLLHFPPHHRQTKLFCGAQPRPLHSLGWPGVRAATCELPATRSSYLHPDVFRE